MWLSCVRRPADATEAMTHAAPALAKRRPEQFFVPSQDFVHSEIIAEPVNVISSLTAYGPPALFGLFGPTSVAIRRRSPQFAAAYVALLTIALGSAALHCFLLALAQARTVRITTPRRVLIKEPQGSDPVILFTRVATSCRCSGSSRRARTSHSTS